MCRNVANRSTFFPPILIAFLFACTGKMGNLASQKKENAVTSSANFSRSRVARMGSKGYFLAFNYQPNGAINSQIHVIDGARYVYETEWGYPGGASAAGEFGTHELATTLPDGEKRVRRFDASGQQQSLRAVKSSENVSDIIVRAQKQNRDGQLEWRDLGDGTREFSVYDASRRLKYTLTKRQVDGETLQAFGYGFDRAHHLTSVLDYCTWLNGAVVCCDPQSSSCSPQENSETYTYDNAGQLIQASSLLRDERFKANAIGNLIQKGGTTLRYEDVRHPHAVTQTRSAEGTTSHYAYNRVGQLTKMDEEQGSTELTWNAQGMPIRVTTKDHVSERRYLGETLYKRREVNSEGETVALYLPGLRVENGLFRQHYDGDAEREPSDSNSRGALRFFHSNHLGSSTLITDETGQVVHRSVFAPYGETRQTDGAYHPVWQFTGKEKTASGLYDYGARLYHPTLGRFISADSEFDGLNPYSYVHNNPINFVDPTGHFKEAPKKVKADEDLVYDPKTDSYHRKGERPGQNFVNAQITPNDGPPRLTNSTQAILELGEFSRSNTVKYMEIAGELVLTIGTGGFGTAAGNIADFYRIMSDPEIQARMALCRADPGNEVCFDGFIFIASTGAQKNKFGIIFLSRLKECAKALKAANALHANAEVQAQIDKVVNNLYKGIEPASTQRVMDASRNYVPGLKEAHAGIYGRVIYSVKKDASGKVTHVDIWAKYDASSIKHGRGHQSKEQTNFFNSVVNAYLGSQ